MHVAALVAIGRGQIFQEIEFISIYGFSLLWYWGSDIFFLYRRLRYGYFRYGYWLLNCHSKEIKSNYKSRSKKRLREKGRAQKGSGQVNFAILKFHSLLK